MRMLNTFLSEMMTQSKTAFSFGILVEQVEQTNSRLNLACKISYIFNIV